MRILGDFFEKNAPKDREMRPNGEISPHLVTLLKHSTKRILRNALQNLFIFVHAQNVQHSACGVLATMHFSSVTRCNPKAFTETLKAFRTDFQ
jgi:hypothetical protein